MRSQNATGAGLTVRCVPRAGGATIIVLGRRHALKFVSYGAPSGRRLVIDMWRNTTAADARILNDGCLKLTRWGTTPGIATARGRELQPLFEHGLVLSLRREGPGRTLIAETPVTATEGVFKADFSGYRIPGRWNGEPAVHAGPGSRHDPHPARCSRRGRRRPRTDRSTAWSRPR